MKTQQELEKLVTRLVDDKAISAQEAVFLLKLGIEKTTEDSSEITWALNSPYPDNQRIFPNYPYYDNGPYCNDNTSGGYVKTTTTDIVNKKQQING